MQKTTALGRKKVTRSSCPNAPAPADYDQGSR
jgi:hypothetical protein